MLCSINSCLKKINVVINNFLFDYHAEAVFCTSWGLNVSKCMVYFLAGAGAFFAAFLALALVALAVLAAVLEA